MEKTISMAQLTKNAPKIVEDIEASGSVYRIKRPGRKTMLLMDKEYFDGWMALMEILQEQPSFFEDLAQSRRDYAAGLGKPLEEVLKELGLDEHSRHAKRRKADRGTSRSRRQRGR